MRILFDQGVPAPLRDFVTGEVSTCYEMNWSILRNGELLAKAEQQFDTFVSSDKNLRYQQAITGRSLAIFILPTTRWPALKPYAEAIAAAILSTSAGDYTEWQLPTEE